MRKKLKLNILFFLYIFTIILHSKISELSINIFENTVGKHTIYRLWKQNHVIG